MSRTTLNLASLGDLDGGAAGAVINAALDKAIADLDDRGSDGQPRKVMIEVALKELNNKQIDASVQVKTSIPAYRTNSTFADIGRKGDKPAVFFQELNPERPDQPTFDVLDRDGRRREKDGDES